MIYEKLVYPPASFVSFAAAAPDLADRILVVNGVSKSSCMTGWRVGFGAGPLPLIKAMNTIQGQTTSHTSSISQHAAIEAISGDQADVNTMVARLQARRDLMVDGLRGIEGMECPVPAGAFYVFAGCNRLVGTHTPSGAAIASDEDLASYLLEAAGVAVVSGSSFLASHFLRLSYATADAEIVAA